MYCASNSGVVWVSYKSSIIGTGQWLAQIGVILGEYAEHNL